MATQADSPLSLAALRILVIEDEYFLADDVASELEACGATVLGPIAAADEAASAIDDARPDCALLDLNLGGEMAFALARRLRARNVPFLLATGYGPEVLPRDLAGIPRIEKPYRAAQAVAALAALCD